MNIVSIFRSLLKRPEGKIGKYILTERLITLFTRIVDALMLYFIITDPKYGFVYAFFIGGIVYFILCSLIIYVNDIFIRNGYDVTGVEELRDLADKTYTQKQYVKRFVSWILRRRSSIFFIGSWFYLDPDYVTLLIRDRRKSFWSNAFKITLPSVVLSMMVWTPIYWALHKGVSWGWLVWFAS